MKEIVTETEQSCPFEFNTDPESFKPGDVVAYQVPEISGGMPFVGVLLEVHDDYVVLQHQDAPAGQDHPMRGTREGKPVVTRKEALG